MSSYHDEKVEALEAERDKLKAETDLVFARSGEGLVDTEAERRKEIEIKRLDMVPYRTLQNIALIAGLVATILGALAILMG